jgi:hypothetical protein
MGKFSRSIACIFFFLVSLAFVQAQDTLQPKKFRRNALKIGTSLTFTKLFVGYEYAATKHIGIGILGTVNGGLFCGYTGNLTARYYFLNYSGFFIEARGGYSYFNPVAYADDSLRYLGGKYTKIYLGEHNASISYWSAGLSGGYRLVCSQRVFFDFLIGAHYGKASFGNSDKYFQRDNILSFGFVGSDKVQYVFNNSGPGFPVHAMVNFGFVF